jgi:hypothetical protein
MEPKESILPAYVATRAGTTSIFLVLTRFLAPIGCLKIPALYFLTSASLSLTPRRLCKRLVSLRVISVHALSHPMSPSADASSPSQRGPTPPPLPLHMAKTGRNHLNKEITPLLPTGIGERFSQTISNLGHAALLRRCELPYKWKCWTNSGGPLVNSLLWAFYRPEDFL